MQQAAQGGSVDTGMVQRHLADIEWRLDVLEQRIKAFEELRKDLEGLRSVVGMLKIEVEEMQEA
jgi:hypothetical protein